MALIDIFWKHSNLIGWISFIIPLVAGWIRYRFAGREIRFLLFILGISFLLTVICYYTGIYYINNLLIYFAQYILEFILYSFLFWKLLASSYARKFILLCSFLLLLTIAINFRIIFMHTSFDSYTPAFVSLALILYCVLFFNRQLNNPQIIFIYKTSWFWIVTGLLLYNAGNFLVFLFTNYLMYRNKELVRLLWHLRDYFDVTKNVLITIGFIYINGKEWKKLF